MAFHVASITKQFTAAAILQLVEAGEVSLDQNNASIDTNRIFYGLLTVVRTPEPNSNSNSNSNQITR